MDRQRTYTEALEELEDIVQALEADAVSIDDLSAKIARAQELIAFCRSVLHQTDEEVQKILAMMRTNEKTPETD